MRVLQILALVLFTTSCHKGPMSSGELLDYVMDPENKLDYTVNTHGTSMEVYYKPSSIIIDQQIQGERDTTVVNDVRRSLDRFDYFIFRLERNGMGLENNFAGNPMKFTEVINYLSDRMSVDIQLICGADTIAVSDIAFSQSFGLSRKTDVMLAFDSQLKNRKGSARLVFSDTEFGTGRHEFYFDTDDVRKIPPLRH